MKDLFPLNVKIGQIQGIISVLKEHDGEISLQMLSNEVLEEIDDLMNVIEACKVLGFIKTRDGKIRLKSDLGHKNMHEIEDAIKKRIIKKQPFFKILEEVKKSGGVSTTELFYILIKKGFINYRDNLSGIKNFKKDLSILGIRLNLLRYDSKNDIWRAV